MQPQVAIDLPEQQRPGVAGGVRRAQTTRSVRYNPSWQSLLNFQRQQLNFKGFPIPPSLSHEIPGLRGLRRSI
jgi:hypothetical protein